MLKFDFRERIQELSSSPVGDDRTLTENEPFYEFLRNILDQEYIIGNSSYGTEEYNRQCKNRFADIAAIMEVFGEGDTELYQA